MQKMVLKFGGYRQRGKLGLNPRAAVRPGERYLYPLLRVDTDEALASELCNPKSQKVGAHLNLGGRRAVIYSFKLRWSSGQDAGPSPRRSSVRT